MENDEVKIRRLTRKSVFPYGYIIDSRCVVERSDGNGFGILLREKSDGWRIAYLVLRKNVITYLENHPDSVETFEPVKGTAVIALAKSKVPKDIRFFLLDKPIALKKRIWHAVASLTKESEIKIVENIKVKTKYSKLKEHLAVMRDKAIGSGGIYV